jgi:hypothetical protein
MYKVMIHHAWGESVQDFCLTTKCRNRYSRWAGLRKRNSEQMQFLNQLFPEDILIRIPKLIHNGKIIYPG